MGGVPKRHGFNENGVKKGSWSAEEDAKLVAYIKRYGIWNWNQMAKSAGLSRTGKSCRLRWMNYLRPNIRHGNITKEEEEIIVRWHQLLGNRWSAIAEKLHGRTDNEIKNYWNTRLKRRYDRSNVDPNAVSPRMSPTTAGNHEKKSIQHSNVFSMTSVPNGSAQEDQVKPNESMSWKVPAAVTNDFCSSSSLCDSSNDTSPLSLDDELRTLLTRMFPEEEDKYMALTNCYHEKLGDIASQDNDGATDLIDQYFLFDLWESY